MAAVLSGLGLHSEIWQPLQSRSRRTMVHDLWGCADACVRAAERRGLPACLAWSSCGWRVSPTVKTILEGLSEVEFKSFHTGITPTLTTGRALTILTPSCTGPNPTSHAACSTTRQARTVVLRLCNTEGLIQITMGDTTIVVCNALLLMPCCVVL